jgi:hypothetical protein
MRWCLLVLLGVILGAANWAVVDRVSLLVAAVEPATP